MSQTYTPTIKPVTAADCDEAWITLRREIIIRDGLAVRGGAGPWIEIQNINRPERWQPLTLPGNALQFTTTADRDTVLAQLWGKNGQNLAGQSPASR